MNNENSGAFELIHSSRLEQLAESLAKSLEEPDGSPLTPKLIIVPQPGVAHWLKLWLAQRLEICANIDFSLPAAFAWKVFNSWLGNFPSSSSFTQPALLWRILTLLPELLVKLPGNIIADYLQNDPHGLRHYQLATRFAQIFDRYLLYRHDWLQAWEQSQLRDLGEQEAFQAELWRKLVTTASDPPISTLFRRAFSQADVLPPTTVLPQNRIHCFGLSQLAPKYDLLLQAVSQKHEVRFYLLNPCCYYWADLVSKRTLAKHHVRQEKHSQGDHNEHLDIGHPLLASWGKPGQFLLKQLYENDLYGEIDQFIIPEKNTILHKIQRSILYTEPDYCKELPETNDNSLIIHACPNRLREIEVVHDALLCAFENDSTLAPSDVAIMVPTMSNYAHLITAIFETAPKECRVPYRIVDRSRLESHPIINCFRTLLNVDNSRFTCSEIFELLATPALARRFGISRSERNILMRWTRESGIRWGLDEEFRMELNIGHYPDYSWKYGLQRLFVGYACGENVDEWQGVAPYIDLEGHSILAVGKLHFLLERLSLLRKTLKIPKPLKEWVNLLRTLSNDFFDFSSDETSSLAAIHELHTALLSLGETASALEHDIKLSSAVIKSALDNELSQLSLQNQFPSTGVTICTLVPMRSIPFRFIAVLGLNVDEFPRNTPRDSLDMIHTHPYPGDRSRRDDERFLFLETLMAARERMHLSYVAKSAKDGKVRSPSIVLEELIDFFSQYSFHENVEKAKKYFIKQHRLYGFSPDYFSGEEVQKSFAYHWLDAAKTIPGKILSSPFISDRWEVSRCLPNQIFFEDLLRFYRNPSKFQLQEHLDIHLESHNEDLLDDEPFLLNGLERYRTREHLLEAALEKGDLPKQLSATLRAKGLFPAGKAGERHYLSERESLMILADRIKHESLNIKTDPRKFELVIENKLLTGLITPQYKNIVLTRTGELKGKCLLQAWICHLIFTCIIEENTVRYAFGVEKKDISTIKFLAISKQRAHEILSELVSVYCSSFSQPVFLFPNVAFSFIDALENGRDPGEAIVKLWNDQSEYSRGEKSDLYTALMTRGWELIDDAKSINKKFDFYAKKIFLPLHKFIEK